MAEKEQERTGRILVTLINPATGTDFTIWTRVATLAERDRLTKLQKEQEKKEAAIRKKYADFVAYQSAALADMESARAVVKRNPELIHDARSYNQEMEDLKTESAFEVLRHALDTNDDRLGKAVREGIPAGLDSEFWRAQPVREVRDAADRFRAIAGVRG